MAKNPLSCGAQCTRITLIALNIIFLLCGIALLVLGLVFKFGGNELKTDIKPTFESIEVQGYNLYSLLDGLAIIFIVVGAVVIGFSFIGFVGAVCYVRVALVIYAILLVLVLILEIAGVVLFFIMRGELEKATTLGMKKSIEKANANDTDYQKATEYMFETYQCCHVDKERLTNTISKCTVDADAFNKDCYEAFKDWLFKYQGAFVGIGIGVIIIEFLLIVCSCWLCRSVSKKQNLV